MNTATVDSFSARLSKELGALDWKSRNDLLLNIGRMELRMRSSGCERPAWHGPVSEDKILGADAVVDTEQGERRGKVICFGVTCTGGENWERTVVIHVPSSGTHHEAPGSAVRLATKEDSERIQSEVAMAQRLSEAADAASRGAASPSPERTRKRGQRDPKLIEEMLALANASPDVRAVEEGGSNHKITGVDKGRRIYLFKQQLRVDLSGFTAEHPGIRQISDDEARDMHLGKVRGQLLFDDRQEALEAFKAALAALRS